jgi:O-antigen ligase
VNAGVDGLDGSVLAGVPRMRPAALLNMPGLLVAVLFLALSFQMVTLKGQLVSGDSNAEPGLKAYHAIFACVGLLLLVRQHMVRWRPEMLAYFLVVGLTTLVASFGFGPRTTLVNTIFAAYAATIGATVGRMAGIEATLDALRWASVGMLGAVLTKALLFLPAIIAFLAAPYGHPTLPTFYGGGPNLEATWVAMAGVFLIGSRLFLPYMLGCAALSVAYASRVGLIVVGLVLVGSVAGSLVSGHGRAMRRWMLPAALVACAVAALMIARGVTGADYVLQRFQSIGDDPGSTGRLMLWTGGVRVFATHPLGVGLGNAVPMIERTLAMNITEDNLHNQYLQHLVEVGVQGLASYLLLAMLNWRRLIATRFQDPLLLFVGIYFVIALVQFRGAEALLWYAYGLQTGTASAGEPAHAG